MTFLLRIFILLAGLLFAASLAVVAFLLLALWGVRAAWAKLTGRPVIPFAFRIDPRAGFGRVYRTAASQSRTPRADSVRTRQAAGEVMDVEARTPR